MGFETVTKKHLNFFLLSKCKTQILLFFLNLGERKPADAAELPNLPDGATNHVGAAAAGRWIGR